MANPADAPDAITGSAEFRSLCPASAAFLSKRIA
jgi:amino-acid N-acetyltransferase